MATNRDADLDGLYSSDEEDEWQEKNIRCLVRTRSVEDCLAPLIVQVTTLVEHGRRNERTHKASRLARAVDKAVDKLIEEGEKIAQENPKIKNEMLKACHSVSTAGGVMHNASSLFAANPQSTDNRAVMVQASRELLVAVTRLLVVADVADIYKLLNATSRVQSRFPGLSQVRSVSELVEKLKVLGPDIGNLLHLAEKRQKDLKSRRCSQELGSARAALMRSSKMLTTSTKVYLEHPHMVTAQLNRKFVLDQMHEAIGIISRVADGEEVEDPKEHSGQLTRDIDTFAAMLEQPLSTQELQQAAKQRMEVIISAAVTLASSEYTRDSHQDQITAECNAVRVQFNKLLQLCTKGQATTQEATRTAHMIQRGLGQLKNEMFKGVSDHVSDIFLDVTSPAVILVDAAEKGDTESLDQSIEFFTNHTDQMCKVVELCNSMCDDMEATKLLHTVSKQFHAITPQLINAAKTAVAKGERKKGGKKSAGTTAQKNLLMFRDAWQEVASLLSDAVDNTTSMHHFLSVSELHIKEDMAGCLEAVRAQDHQMLDQHASLVRGRCMRLLHVVQNGMAKRSDLCTADQLETVNQAVMEFRNKALSSFSTTTDKVYNNLLRSHDPSETDFLTVEASVLNMRDAMSDLRRTVAMNMPPEEIEGDDELEELVKPPRPASPLDYTESNLSTSSLFTRTLKPSISNPGTHDGAQERMAQLPVEQQEQLAKASESLTLEQSHLENEMNKWEGSKYHDDVIVLAKEMCLLMMDMSDFTR